MDLRSAELKSEVLGRLEQAIEVVGYVGADELGSLLKEGELR